MSNVPDSPTLQMLSAGLHCQVGTTCPTCPCSRELVIQVLVLQGCSLCRLLVFSFLVDSMRLTCYLIAGISACSSAELVNNPKCQGRNISNVLSIFYSCKQAANLFDAVKDPLPKMHMVRAKRRVSATLLSRCVVLPGPTPRTDCTLQLEHARALRGAWRKCRGYGSSG